MKLRAPGPSTGLSTGLSPGPSTGLSAGPSAGPSRCLAPEPGSAACPLARRRLLGGAAALAGLACAGTKTAAASDGPVEVIDDRGLRLRLPRPARRIVSIAPHLAELAFAAGAGERLVGVSAYSEHPAAARRLPRIGDSNGVDLERILALQPDLVLAWDGGTPERQLARLDALGLPVFHDHPRRLADIAHSIERIGRLAGCAPQAEAAGAALRERLAALRAAAAGKPPVRVFFQVWHQPLLTVSGRHLIDELIGLCGGVNVFAGLRPVVPQLGLEAVLREDPELMIATAEPGLPDPLAPWRAWPGLRAVARGQLLRLDGGELGQPTPRMLDTVGPICAAMEAVRARRAGR